MRISFFLFELLLLFKPKNASQETEEQIRRAYACLLIKDIVDVQDDTDCIKIQAGFDALKLLITMHRWKFDNLKIGIDMQNFEALVTAPTKHIFHGFHRFIENSFNSSSREALIEKCQKHFPNSILETLHDLLTQDWLIEQAKHYKLQSTSLNILLEKLDLIIETLTICQPSCSNKLTGNESAKDGIIKLEKTVKKIVKEVNRTKEYIHKNFFGAIRKYVKESYYGLSPHIKILKHLQTKYNYGPLYTVQIIEYTKDLLLSDPEEFSLYGNVQTEYAFIETIEIGARVVSVYVAQASSLCTFNRVENKLLLDSLIDTCTENSSLSSMYKNKCGSNYICIYAPAKSCDQFITGSAPYESYLASNGGICGIGLKDHLKAVISKPFSSDFVYKPLKDRRMFGTKGYYENVMYDEKIIFFDLIEYEEKALFMERFSDMLANKTNITANEEGTTHATTGAPPTRVLFSAGRNLKKGYSNFRTGYNYAFYGKLICRNDKPIGNKAVVNLIEVDPYFDDTVTSSKIEDGYFTLRVGSDYGDSGSADLELKLEFKNVCGHYFDQYNGFLMNSTLVHYII